MGYIYIVPETSSKLFTSETNYSNYILIVDAYSKSPKNYGMEWITTEEVMDKLDIFQSRFVKIDEFGWWDIEGISEDAGSQFTSTVFQDAFQTHGVHLTSTALEHPEMNRQVKVT